MASSNTNILTQDIFQTTKFIHDLQKKYVDISEDTLYLGIYGFLHEYFSSLVQNTATMVSEYSLEAIPTRAKFERNILCHALALGINKITATPAQIDVILAFPEDYLVANMVNDKIIIDKDYSFTLGERTQYPYRLDYDVIIKRNVLPNGKIVYTAMYDLDDKNPYASKANPYLTSIGVMNANGQRIVSMKTTLRQTSHSILSETINIDNPLQTMTLTFQFQDQLSHFYVECTETDDDGNEVVHYLKPIYEGLYDYKSEDEYINYMYLDEKTIRLKFNRSSYQPRHNAEVDVHVYTTLGSECNFELSESYQVLRAITSDRFSYNGLYVSIITTSDSIYGEDRATVEVLKEYIPREALARGSYSTYTDLMTFFNIIQTEDCKMTVLERVYNQVEHIFFTYLLMKYQGNVIPTNSIDVSIDANVFSSVSKDNYIISPGIVYYLSKGSSVGLAANSSEIDSEEYERRDGFVYVSPYLTVINKNPFYVSFYNVFINYTRSLYFSFINDDSDLQFIVDNFYAYRNYFDNENNEVHIQITMTQNINTDYDILTYDSDGNLIDCAITPKLVLYTKDSDGISHAYRYLNGTLINYEGSSNSYVFDFVMATENVMAGRTTHMLFNSGCNTIGTGTESPAYLSPTVEAKLFILVKEDQEYGRVYGDKREYTADSLFPIDEIEGYTLTNVYITGETGIDLFYDYTDLMSSYIQLEKTTDKFQYKIHRVPVIRDLWWNSEDKVIEFFRLVDYRRRYIQQAVNLLEDSFGINYKLYNTYGPSSNWNINKSQNIDRVNISLKFEIKFATNDEAILLPEIEQVIKNYIEDFNSIDTDLHMSNCITYVKNLYSDSIEYIKFVGLNKYDSLWQSVSKNPKVASDYFAETQNVPEFINVHSFVNGSPDITFDVKK